VPFLRADRTAAGGPVERGGPVTAAAAPKA
jgi:hypothetical protein